MQRASLEGLRRRLLPPSRPVGLPEGKGRRRAARQRGPVAAQPVA